MMWFFISVIWLQILYSSSQQFRHSAAGEYYVEWKEFGPCSDMDNRTTSENFIDVHLTRRHRKPELVGNMTINVPFDDTTPLKVNFNVLGSNAAWVPNFYKMTFPRGCTDGLEGIFKQGWVDYMKSFNISPACPVPKGFFQTKGFDPDNFIKNSVLPKQFIYGHYKMVLEYMSKKRDVPLGCTYVVLDIVPIWQKKKRN